MAKFDETLVPEDDEDAPVRIELSDGLIREVREALDEDNRVLAAALAEPLHPADFADLLENLDREGRFALIKALGPRFDAEALAYLDETLREDLMRDMGPAGTGAALAQLDTDDAIDLIADLDEAEKRAILSSLPLPERAAIERGLAYPESSAGRLMAREVVAVPDYWTVGQTIDYLRTRPDLPDDFYDVYIVDPGYHAVGSIPVSHILRAKRGVPITELDLKTMRRIFPETDQEEVAFLFRQYGLVSAPVIDAEGRLLGVITIDDVVDVIQEEAEEDFLKLGGVQESDVFQPPLRTGRQRLPWLLVNLGTAILASLVIAQFEDAIVQLAALAVLMPIIASMGGNAGSQTMTVTVRALAVRELTPGNAWRMLGKELVVSFINGGVFFVVGIGIALFWFEDPGLALVFGAAMIVNLLAAGVAGMLIPFVIDRLGLDPAVSSSVFLTTVTDVVGFFAFLGLAVYFLL